MLWVQGLDRTQHSVIHCLHSGFPVSIPGSSLLHVLYGRPKSAVCAENMLVRVKHRLLLLYMRTGHQTLHILRQVALGFV